MDPSTLVYLVPLAVIMAVYLGRRRRAEAANRAVQQEARSAGLLEPASLHPLIDASRCIGCGACVKACPEQPAHHVLGLIDGKATLVGPTDCIGHGACSRACPVGAIQLVFGSEKRGVEIPSLTPDFETTVPGIYIAGELGGMGLIRNAVEQGRQAVEAIGRSIGKEATDLLDLVVVGAGPAGFSASLAAKQAGLRFETLEQDSLGGCVFQYPRGKLVMTQPAELPLVGRMDFRNTSKEALLRFWQDAERRSGLRIRYRHRVLSIEGSAGDFTVRSDQGDFRCRRVLLAIGRRGTPRPLSVEGEQLPKVVYRLVDAEQYAGQRVLVVGGGDSALEAAASVAEQPGTDVTLSYRGDAFQRARPRNRERVEAARREGRLRVLLGSTVQRITADSVLLAASDGPLELPNDAVIINAGGVLPTALLAQVGIGVEVKHGQA